VLSLDRVVGSGERASRLPGDEAVADPLPLAGRAFGKAVQGARQACDQPSLAMLSGVRGRSAVRAEHSLS
jgi:hypothetical protein